MIYRLFFLSFLFAFAACSPVETVENKDEKGVLLEKYSRRKDTFAKQGKYQAFYPSGKLLEESLYENDTLHGERKLFYENGKTQSIERLEHGRFIGKYQKFYENGQLANEGEYVNNEMSGVWKRWYDTGELREEVFFEHNEENGPFREFYQNGKLKTSGNYLQGDNENGELLKYDENGEVYERMYCEFGICVTAWSKQKGDSPIDTALVRRLVELRKKKSSTNEE
jgi:antitoxin component YwqK of YwqJK toxin-antitoxin module